MQAFRSYLNQILKNTVTCEYRAPNEESDQNVPSGMFQSFQFCRTSAELRRMLNVHSRGKPSPGEGGGFFVCAHQGFMSFMFVEFMEAVSLVYPFISS